MTVVDIMAPKNAIKPTPETFDTLVFYSDGSVAIQTDISIYFYATARVHAAQQLVNVVVK